MFVLFQVEPATGQRSAGSGTVAERIRDPIPVVKNDTGNQLIS